jgi:PAS domain S-box-containing protein
MDKTAVWSDLWSRLETLAREPNGTSPSHARALDETIAELRRLLDEQKLLLSQKTAREDQLHARVDQLEQALEGSVEQMARYRELFEFAPDPYFITDVAGAILEANRAAVSQLGLSPELLHNKPLPFFVVPEHRVALYQRLSRIHHRHEGTYNWETRVQPRGALPLDVLITITPITDGEGNVTRLRWLVRDVTEMQRMRERALQLERLAVLGGRAADLAHDGRNLLARVQGLLQRASWSLDHQEDLAAILNRAMGANEDLVRLFNDVCGYAGSLRLDFTTCHLSEIWRPVWEDVAALHPERRGRLVEQTGGVELTCTADPLRLRQVFRNLFDNAWTACLGDVEVTVLCAAAMWKEQPALTIAIRDNGPGLRTEERAHLFEPFFTTKKHGTGLGLTITHRIIEGHGGHIEAHNAATGGAEFLITLPRRRP